VSGVLLVQQKSLLTTSDIGSVVLGGVGDQRSPSTSNVEHPVALLQVEFLANHVELVVLELLEGLLLVDVGDDTGSVDHSGSQEPRVKVVASVVVVSDLVLVLALRVDDDLGDQVGEDVFEQLRG
jgi:hypothetical protein